MLDSTKIRQELNWRDQVTVNEGVDETILWVKENFNTLSKLPTEYLHKK
jgi:dTDP-glucose 4,6-dehydratase